MSVDLPEWLESPSFDRLDGGVIRWRTGLSERFAIDALAKDIVDEYLRRQQVRQQAEKDEVTRAKLRDRKAKKHLLVPVALKWLKPVCYNAILSCLHRGVFDQLEDRAAEYGRLVRGPKGGRSIFMIGLMGIFAHTPREDVGRRLDRREGDQTERPPVPDEKQRSRMVQDMWWAFRHYVEPSEFNVFIRQNRAELRRLGSALYLLEDHHDQIARRRAVFTVLGSVIEDLRALLPADIGPIADSHHEELERRLFAARVQPQAENWEYAIKKGYDLDDGDDDWDM